MFLHWQARRAGMFLLQSGAKKEKRKAHREGSPGGPFVHSAQ